MSLRKFSVLTILLIGCACFLSSQSLVEAAKQEKERRAKLKGIKSVVVTNETLQKRKIEPALSYKPIKSPYEEVDAESDVPEGRSLDAILPQEPAEKRTASFIDIKTLEDRWQEAQEYVALLTLKLNSLQQEYYSMDDMTPRSHIQQQISDTYLKLQKAQKDLEQAKKDLDEAREKIKKRNYRK
jgi:hypothetical protein